MCGVPGEAFVFNEFYIESPTGYSYFDFTTEPGGNSLGVYFMNSAEIR